MKRVSSICAALTLIMAALAPSAAAAFDLEDFDVAYTNSEGSPVTQAGSHPFAIKTYFKISTEPDAKYGEVPQDSIKDLTVQLPVGFAGTPTSTPRCSGAEFADIDTGDNKYPACSNSTVIGTVAVRIKVTENISYFAAPVYNLEPPPGVTARFGFVVLGAPVTIEAGVNPEDPHNVIAKLTNTTQAVAFYGGLLTIWGNPADPVHDAERGTCVKIATASATPDILSRGSCPVNIAEKPFLRMPTSCTGPLRTDYEASAWNTSGSVGGRSESHDNSVPPNPLGLSGCSRLAFSPRIGAKPTSSSAESPSGLDVDLAVDDEGIASPNGLSQSDIEKTVVTLPEGMTINPSQAEGLGACSLAEYESSGVNWYEGCRSSSKIGDVEVQTPLLEGEILKGSLYVAKPYENPYGTLIALYVVVRDPQLGIVVPLAGKVEPNSRTGQLVSTFDDIPQVPVSRFHLHFREGGRSPLVTPPLCGTYETKAVMTPWSNPASTYTTISRFDVTSGSGGGACPAGGMRPFHPGLQAGTINNAAGGYSPFNLKITRSDSEQEITNFSIKLPPGITGKLAGIPECPDAAIAAAKARERQPHGGQEELDSPSCPAASQVGRTLVGAGVGSEPTYVPGKLYLAGPYNGSPLSIVAITAAKAGPFDLGTVVIRYALKINPETAEVFVDATGSDPIPHIVNGIPVHLRDIRAYVDRPSFVLNPTSCERTSTASTVLGSGLDFASSADDVPLTVTSPFQAADCASLSYKPRLTLKLKGGTKRGANPALTATLLPRAGDANSKRIAVALPHSEFLDQSHIKTICTRVQFKTGAGNGAQCPQGSIYGHAKAWTPLLSEPLEGPIFLRSSEHPLPDLVLALHGQVEFTAVGRIDSHNGGIRNTFEAVPDAPISKVVVSFEGGKKGLLVNSTDICKGSHKATVQYGSQSGRQAEGKVPLQARCRKAPKKHKRKAKGHAGARAAAIARLTRAW